MRDEFTHRSAQIPVARLAPERLVAIDVETTGFSSRDRVVEVAAVSINPVTWQTIDEFDTLVNPQRDVGSTGVHGITASMVEAAPTFEEIAADLARRLHRGILIAHNLPFDARMLKEEFSRLGVSFDVGSGICTLQATRYKLHVACERFGVAMSGQHRALSDARATALLARNIGGDFPNLLTGATIGHIAQSLNPRTHRRSGSGGEQSHLSRVVSRAYYPHSDEAEIAYLAALDLALDDYRIDYQERVELGEVAVELGLSRSTCERAHRAYLKSIIAAARRDGVTTADEADIIDRVARTLGVSEVSKPVVSCLPELDEISEGMRVCFTGQACLDGKPVKRAMLEEISAEIGLQPVSRVSKHGCDLLVAANVSSGSNKAKLARRYRIPILGIESYVDQLGIGELTLENLHDGLDPTDWIPPEEVIAASEPSLGQLIGDLGIPRVGVRLADQLASHFLSVDALASAGIEDLLKVDGIGPRVASIVRSFFTEPANSGLVEALRGSDIGILDPRPTAETRSLEVAGKTFVVTGSLSKLTRRKAHELILASGGKVTSSVSKKTDYLVAGKRPGSKLSRALEFGVVIISEDDLQGMLSS